MGDLIRLADHIYPWKQVYAIDSANSTLQIYMNEGTGELEVVQMNDEGEAIRTCLSTCDSITLASTFAHAHQKIRKK